MTSKVNGIHQIQSTKKTAPSNEATQSLAEAPPSYSWTRNHNLSDKDFYLRFSAAAAVHNSQLWLMFANWSGTLVFDYEDNAVLGNFQQLNAAGQTSSASPALCDVDDTLHCVFPQNSSEFSAQQSSTFCGSSLASSEHEVSSDHFLGNTDV